MENRPVDPLFKIAYLMDVPPFTPEVYETDVDPLRRWVSIGMDSDPDWTDETWKGGFFIDDGVNISFDHMVWMMRQVNVNHPRAMQWLQNNGWDLEPSACSWLHHIVFTNGKQLTTASKHRFEDAWRPKIDGHEFVITEGAVIAVRRVANVHSIWGITQNFAESIQRAAQGNSQDTTR